jgi:hypothetical protein
MEIRIMATPPGEAPLSVRRACVGLVLPLRPGEIRNGPPRSDVCVTIKTRVLLKGDATMTQIILDATLRSKLGDLAEPLELCDEAGRVVARVIPSYDAAAQNLKPQISQEEMRRRKQSKGQTYTTAEVLAHLEKL